MEGKEALLMLAREILFGKLAPLLDRLIIIICPNFNVDGNDMLAFGDGTPHLIGSGNNAQNLNLNRDAVRVDTVEVQGLYRNVFNRWDPTLVFDAHMMGRVQHGYANNYIHSTVPAAAPEPRDYVFDTLFPAIREATRKHFGLEVFTHSATDDAWPPTMWGPERAIWTNEAKFVANAYGLRNRMSILAETPGHESFERRIYAHVALMTEVLRYAAAHGQEMRDICRRADAAVEKLRTHNVKVDVLTAPIRVSGQEFVIDRIGQGRGGGYAMIKLDGGFAPSPVKEFPAGTYRVDLAQPMANLAFYLLEPQAADGFVGSGVFDAVFASLGAGKRSIVYPVYKYFKVVE
jgi:hypothetical protein